MEVVSLCPFRAASLLWQPQRGTWAMTIVVKGTFALEPGESPLAGSQEYVNEDDNHWNDDPERSLYSPTDLVPFKPRSDVMLVGHAFAPRKEPVRSIVARLVVGDINKAIEVYGERAWTKDGMLREGPRFSKMPLRYERAAGGPDTENPVGIRGEPRADQLGSMQLPNLQPPGRLVSEPSERIEPIGFGPIAPAWPGRRARLGKSVDSISLQRLVEEPLPDDLDPNFFNAAPRDQQMDELRPNERIVLEHLHPEHPRLVTNLPGLSPRVFLDVAGGAGAEISMSCDTLWIDTDRGISTLTWRGQVPLEHPRQAGRVLVAIAEQGQPLTWADIQRSLAIEQQDTSINRDTAFAARATNGTETEAGRAVADSKPPQAAAPEAVKRSRTVVGAPENPRGPAATLPFIAPPSEYAKRNGPRLAREATVDPPTSDEVTSTGLLNSPAAALPPPPPPPQPPAIPPPPPPSVPIQPASSPPKSVTPPRANPRTAPPPPPAYVNLNPREGLVAASTAAAVAWVDSRGEVSAVGPTVSSEIPPPLHEPRVLPREMIELLWCDGAAMSRVRDERVWKGIFEQRSGVDDRDARDAATLLARGEFLEAEALPEILASAVADDGIFTPPLVLVAGDLTFPFDELETLKAVVIAVTPHLLGDPALRDAVEAVNELLKKPWLESSAGIAEGVAARVKEAFGRANPMLAPSFLETRTDRVLLERRSYQHRAVLGDVWIRSLFSQSSVAQPMPLYLPRAIAKTLPLFQRFRGRVIAEVHVQQDQYETHPTALRAIALGRAMPLRR